MSNNTGNLGWDDLQEAWEEMPTYPNDCASWNDFAEQFIRHKRLPFMLLVSRCAEYTNGRKAIEKSYVFGIASHHCKNGVHISVSPMSFSAAFMDSKEVKFVIFQEGLNEKSLFLSDEFWVIRYKIEAVSFDPVEIDEKLSTAFTTDFLNIRAAEYVDAYQHVMRFFFHYTSEKSFVKSRRFFQDLKEAMLRIIDNVSKDVQDEINKLEQSKSRYDFLRKKLD